MLACRYKRCWQLPPTCLCMGIAPISNDSKAQLGPMVQSQVRVQVGPGLDLWHTDNVQWGMPDSKEVIKQV